MALPGPDGGRLIARRPEKQKWNMKRRKSTSMTGSVFGGRVSIVVETGVLSRRVFFFFVVFSLFHTCV